jgi:hypothetical protein
MTNQPRNRAVVFRLSQEEYRLLKEACEREGARNLSEFARAGILDHLHTDVLSGHLNQRMALLERQIAAMQFQIDHLLPGAFHVESIS